MTLHLLPLEFTVCQIADTRETDMAAPFTFLSRTDDEISLVCPVSDCPANALKRDDGWVGLKIAGPLDFSLIGILSQIAGCLAREKIPIFALSTFNTDYVLFKKEHKDKALQALAAAGHEILL